ncbi:ABC transporter permease [Jiangella rhizosphaerae]|uniref:ABC transporter permease n=1 Tax=Jiangella rhizosphaerae TaxID=2293569 RepID=A0A418KVB9_9ACTN|nr:ABC transporter permease [Jiangella rhizosphaerae]RIQ34183.1 ABC transporter permease [Jiangella rhizosphaerae]
MRALRLAVRLRPAKLALAVLGLVVVLMAVGDTIAPYDPLHQDTTAILAGPSAEHWLGTDYVGRDVLSRLLAGSRLSVVAAAEAVGLGLLLGVLPGLASVYFGRVFEWLSLRVMDGLMALPFIIFAIAVAALLGNGLHQAMFAVGVLLAPTFYRVTRAAAIGLRQAQYVEAGTLFGATRWRIVRTHVWQKVLPTVVVTTATAMAGALLVVSSLTFLGIGVQPPAPTWGGMLASDLGYLTQRPFGPVAPALLIIVTVAALNALADAIRDATGDGAPASAAPLHEEVPDAISAAVRR